MSKKGNTCFLGGCDRVASDKCLWAGTGEIDACVNLNHGGPDCGRDWISPSAEGATAPETLRQKDRSRPTTLESGPAPCTVPPKEQPPLKAGNLSGEEDRGGTDVATR